MSFSDNIQSFFQNIQQLITIYSEGFTVINTSNNYGIQSPDIINHLSDEDAFELMIQFKENINDQPNFLLISKKVFKLSLSFTRATWQELWNLYLASLDLMIIFFFANDLQNYTQLMPNTLHKCKN